MRLYALLSTLVFLLGLLPRVRSGLGASEMHCTNLQGICRRDICKLIEDEIGACRRRWKCCRLWWILIPIPTPVIFSDYQEPLKSKIK
ncbi:beta-defensin 109-like [Grammomys surdaster]|uniref:beta-defensin 109-like n=1 Tax=Grammomys surdaster TaxID=491861 RepID=UPI00109F52C9|nr:beta-defensin 109-like [Grammomys surdaster]